MKPMTTLERAVLVALFLFGATPTVAAIPDGIDYQAYLSAADGSAINADISITFAVYNVDVGGVPLWPSTQSVSPVNGLFSVTLGNPVNPFPAGLFDTPVFVGLFVAGEEMLPRRPLQSSAFSFKSEDANTLTGMTASELDQSAAVTALESTTDGLSTSVSTNATDIAAAQSATATNAANIVTNDTRISVIEGSAGDITSVLAGTGLTGGSTSGSATLAIANGGVSSAQLAANAVDSSKVADGSLNAADLAANDTYTLNGVVTNNFTATGAIELESAADINIYDTFNGLRWRDPNNSNAQMASIEVRQQDVTFRDGTRSRALIRSTDNGIGIGTFSPVSTHDVTIQSLAVIGETDIGLQRVTTTYDLTSESAACHSHGNLPCFYGIGTVTCPVGTRVLGGGASGSSGLFGSLSVSAPQTDTTFTCAASYDIANSTRTCYAICGRVR